jgi:RimJ/RimL family protein N-acetyltransferase
MPPVVPVLTGQRVQLEPLSEAHRAGLRAAADDPRIWQHMIAPLRGPEFDTAFDLSLAQHAAGQRVPFAVRRLADGRLIGSTSYIEPHERHKRVEIGATWYVPDEWGAAVNPECKLLLLQHAFEEMGFNRVSFITDVRNERSQAAIAKLGAVREGILRSHMVVQGGRIRDSVQFSIIVSEWPAVKARLVARLASV